MSTSTTTTSTANTTDKNNTTQHSSDTDSNKNNSGGGGIVEGIKNAVSGITGGNNKDNDDKRRRSDFDRDYDDYGYGARGRGGYDRDYDSGYYMAGGHHGRGFGSRHTRYGNGDYYNGSGYGRDYDRYDGPTYERGNERTYRSYDRPMETYSRGLDSGHGFSYPTGYGYGSRYGSSYDSGYGSRYGSSYDSGYGSGYSTRSGSGYTTGYGDNYSTSYGGINRYGTDYNSYGTRSLSSGGIEGFSPAMDLSETDKEWHLHAELPGIDKKDVNVTCHNGKLTVSGERKAQNQDGTQGRKYHRTERVYGSFSRTFNLPMPVDNKDVKANFNNGVLEVSITKPQEYLNRNISVA